MATTAITAEGIGKRYLIAHDREPYGRLSESIMATARAPFAWLRGRSRQDTEWFWAVKDVSFEIETGDVVGVIGRNGAGKSTLLKLLARITEPTAGEITLRGRVGSLLEVGTGFHPELTGRENIFLSGSILGMRRAEINRRFDQIVDFAGVEQFVDTPVKRYSSGMQVRLGFAVAAHLEPEILLIDEVLAVGDASFQAKCLGRLEEIGNEGRTVLFVSHSMPSIQRLCSRAILLDAGGVVAEGSTSEVVGAYMSTDNGSPSRREWDAVSGPGDEVARLRRVRILGPTGAVSTDLDISAPIDIEVVYDSANPNGLRASVNLHLYNDAGVCLFVSNDWDDRKWWRTPRAPAQVTATCRIPGDFLAEGRHYVTVAISTYNPTIVHALERDAVAFNVSDSGSPDGVRGEFTGDMPGVVRPRLGWRVATGDRGDSIRRSVETTA